MTLFVLQFQLHCNILYTYIELIMVMHVFHVKLYLIIYVVSYPKLLISTLRVLYLIFNDRTFKCQSNYERCVNEIRQITVQIICRVLYTSR